MSVSRVQICCCEASWGDETDLSTAAFLMRGIALVDSTSGPDQLCLSSLVLAASGCRTCGV